MTTATIRQVQHNLASVLRSVEAGQEVEIRHRNRPVAKLVPLANSVQQKANWSSLPAWRQHVFPKGKVRGKTVAALVAEGRGER